MGIFYFLGVQIAGIVWGAWVLKGEMWDAVGLAAAVAMLGQVWMVYRAPDGGLNTLFLGCVGGATLAISGFAVFGSRSASPEPSTEFFVAWLLATAVMFTAAGGIIRGGFR